jgi:hypothetical protein
MHRKSLSLAILALLGLAPAVHAAPAILSFEPEAVVASGLAPGGRVALFSVAREAHPYVSRVVRREEILTDDDGDGVVQLELGGPVPVESVWMAIDLADGSLTVAAPEGTSFRELSFDPRVLRQETSGVVRRIRDGRVYLEAFLVRPGAGAWGVSLGDGGETDDDETVDGAVQASLAAMRPVGATVEPPPDSLAPGDVLALVDPNALVYFATRFAR